MQQWSYLLQAQYLLLVFLAEWVLIHLLNVLMVGRMALQAFQARHLAPGAHVCSGIQLPYVRLCAVHIDYAGTSGMSVPYLASPSVEPTLV